MARSTRSRIHELGPAHGSEPDDDVRPVALPVFIMASLLAFVILLVFGIWFGIKAVEKDIEEQALSLLTFNNQPDVKVSVDGRDVALFGLADVTGRADPDGFVAIDLPEYMLANLRGVDSVTADLGFWQPEREARDIVIAPDPLTVSWTGRTATLTGTVSEVAVLEDIVGVGGESPTPGVWADVFTSLDHEGFSVRQDTASERDWLPTVITLVNEMQPLIQVGEVFVNPLGEVVRVTGHFDSSLERNKARETAKDILSSITFSFNSALTYEAPPTELPPPPEQLVIELQTNLDELIEGKVVEFESDSDVITAAGQALLDEVLVALLLFPEIKVEIGGHTDDVGSDEYNLDLSRRRAEAVLTFLVGRGDTASRFVVVGYGELDPVADNATPDGRARNRRIEFTAFTEGTITP